MLLFSEFRSGKSPLLVATDVASRGLGMYASSLGQRTGFPGTQSLFSIFRLSFIDERNTKMILVDDMLIL